MIVLHTHRYHAPKFQPNPKHHDGVLIFSHFARAAACLLACCLLAACCLLLAAAKPGRSTLDTKKGYKTKTGSTSSVTLAITLALTPPPLHPWLDAPLTPARPPPRPPAGTPPPPTPGRNTPPPQVLKDSWGVDRIRTGCSRPPPWMTIAVAHQAKGVQVFPPRSQIFAAFDYAKWEDLKVVIIGQGLKGILHGGCEGATEQGTD